MVVGITLDHQPLVDFIKIKTVDNQHVSQRSGCSTCKNGTLCLRRANICIMIFYRYFAANGASKQESQGLLPQSGIKYSSFRHL
jgi:hypothetical protein